MGDLDLKLFLEFPETLQRHNSLGKKKVKDLINVSETWKDCHLISTTNESYINS